MVKLMGILNLTPDSFYAPSRSSGEAALQRIIEMQQNGAHIIDIGAVSTRPGAADVSVEEEWARLQPVLSRLDGSVEISIDTTSSEIVRRAYDTMGRFIVNDISAGEDDSSMLETVAALSLPYVAMHKRGNPRSMDSMCDYSEGVVPALLDYFRSFSLRASQLGIKEWILDPGLGFAKTPEQCWEILERLPELKALGHPVLIGASRKRFTGGDTKKAHALAIERGADILRIHDFPLLLE